MILRIEIGNFNKNHNFIMGIKDKKWGIKMDQYVINEQPLENGAYEIHNVSKGCSQLPQLKEQINIGFFANYDLAQKRARINWPREKIQPCTQCCQ